MNKKSTTVRVARATRELGGQASPLLHVFDETYHEKIVLRDGTTAHLHLMRPADKEVLSAGFQRLSAQSRFTRFFTSKPALSAGELRFLTEIDGEFHVALGAWRVCPDGTVEGLGVARFVRLPGDPSKAEPAVAVVDEWQGKGLGRALLARLVGAAREREVDEFQCTVLAYNQSMLSILRALPGATFRQRGDTVEASIDLGIESTKALVIPFAPAPSAALAPYFDSPASGFVGAP